MKINYHEIATYDNNKFNEERKLLHEKSKEIFTNYKNNTPRLPTITKSGKSITTTYPLSWEKELQNFIWDLICHYTNAKHWAYSLYQQVEKYYSELSRCNQAYSPSVIKERNLFMDCDWIYDHGLILEENKIKVTRFNEFGKKRKLDEILWLVVKAKKYAPYCNREFDSDLFQGLLRNYLKYRSKQNKLRGKAKRSKKK